MILSEELKFQKAFQFEVMEAEEVNLRFYSRIPFQK